VKELDPLLPQVTGVRSQLVQVIMNIMINAVQAMDEKGTIRIATRSNPARDSVEVTIADTGRGIAPDQIDRIFDPFFTTKESGRGTGLGLSIAYGIVTTHRGTISVQSEPGNGSTFTIRFPIAAGIPREVPE
jgi:two-component system NtrC family sensor kinase